MGEKTVSVSVYATQSLFRKLSKVAEGQRRSYSQVFTLAMEEFLAKPENVRFWSENFGTNPGQVHLEDAIAAAVKRGPVKSKAAKHK